MVQKILLSFLKFFSKGKAENEKSSELLSYAISITADLILETYEFEFPAQTVFANNFLYINLTTRF